MSDLVILLIWSVHLKSSDMVTQRYLAEGTLSNTHAAMKRVFSWKGIFHCHMNDQAI